ncbi:MAG: ABC transporter permease [Phaeodactylibacter sp.]|nr:ABC transporter permease [Phaeodactylibacter sp.]
MLHNYLTAILRHIRKRRVSSLINIAGLAVGLASSMLILLYVRHELSYDRYQEKADRIFRLTRAYDYPSGYNQHFARVPDTWINELPQAIPGIERLLRLQEFRTAHIRIGDRKFREAHAFATDAYAFDVFSFPLLRGNSQTALSAPNSVVLSQSLAEKYFGEKDPIGQAIQLFGEGQAEAQEYKVTGVMQDLPSTSHFKINLLTSFRSPEQRTGWAYVYLLLEPGTDPAQLAAKFPGFIEQHIDEENAAETNRLHLQPITSIHLHSHMARELQPNGSITNVYIFSLVALFILLLAGINFVNLSIAQSSERARELGMRKILGSSRRQLIAYLLSESCVYACIAFGLALLLIYFAQPWFETLAGARLDAWNGSVMASFGAVALLTGLLAGLYPAVQATASKAIDVLKNQTAIVVAGGRFPLRKVLATLQFTISIGLIICTAVTYQQFRFLQNKNLGFNQDQVISIPDIPRDALKDYYTLKQSIESLPGVKGMSAAMAEPSQHIRDAGPTYAEGLAEEEGPIMDILPVGPNFFELMGIELSAGVDFSAATIDESNVEFPDSFEKIIAQVNRVERSYILNEAAVAAVGWKSPEQAIGKAFSWSNSAIEFQRGPIIGVVKDFNFHSLHDAVRPMVMVYEPQFFSCFLIKASPQNASQALTAIKTQWDALLPNYAFEYHFLDEQFAQLYASEKRQANVLGLFAMIAIFIAGLGILGLAAIAANQRRKEIGIRKVLGASVFQIVHLLNKEFILLILLANLFAWPVAYWLMRQWLQGFAYRVAFDPLLLLLAGLLTLAVALLAAGWHSVRAATANPVESIRME